MPLTDSTTGQYQALSAFVEQECQNRLRAYAAQPRDAAEHFETENEALSGGYAYRQLFELVQNAADAILESGDSSGRIEVVLRASRLEVANTGAPLNRDGVIALLNARSSSKRGEQIGRFGIGFKSLLKLGGKVALHSRTVGLRFEPAACRARILDHIGLPPTAKAPGMRLATPLDPMLPGSPLSEGSPFSWATTVVVAEVPDPSVHARLASEIEAFPAEFLLFLPIEIDLLLRVEGGKERHVMRLQDGNVAYLDDGDAGSKWRLFETKVRIEGSEARSDATHVQARDEIPLAWAMPMEGREQAGRFWAFFPTETNTHVPGILNAPWKLNSDRTNIVRGAYNDAVMQEAAKLVAASLPSLLEKDDMGAIVAAFPRRLDRQDDISAPLVKALWDEVLATRCLPDVNGALHLPHVLARHPVEDHGLAKAWARIAPESAKASLVHPDCYASKSRVSRLDSLEAECRKRGAALLPKPDLANWLEVLASPSLEGTRNCLSFMEGLSRQSKKLGGLHVPRVDVVPTEDGPLCALADVVISSAARPIPGILQVAAPIANDPECRRILIDVFDVAVLSEDDWDDILRQAFDRAFNEDTNGDWDAFWQCLLEAPEADAATFMQEASLWELKFKSRAGEFVPRELLVATGNPMDIPASHLMDLDYHESHRYRMPSGSFAEYPPGWVDTLLLGESFAGYIDKVQPAAYQEILRRSTGSKPQQGMILARAPRSSRHVRMPASWRLLEALPAMHAARLTLHLLQEMDASVDALAPITFEHQTRRETYPSVKAPHPLYWILSRYGMIGLGALTFPLRGIPYDWIATLRSARAGSFGLLAGFLDARENGIDLSGIVPWPGLPTNNLYGREFWPAALGALEASPCPPGILLQVWELAASHGAVPDKVNLAGTVTPITDLLVTADPSVLHTFPSGDVLLLPPATARAWEAAGARLISEASGTTSVARTLAPPCRVSSVFPELLAFEEVRDVAEGYYACWVTGLKRQAGPVSSEPPVAWCSEDILLLDESRFKELGWTGFVPALLGALVAKLEGEVDAPSLEARLVAQRNIDARNAVRSCEGVEHKLLMAIGGLPGPLLESLPPATRRAVPEGIAPDQLASLAIAVHGPAILRKMEPAMQAAGLDPPSRWTGDAALEFILDLGFPVEFATGMQARRSPSLDVNGPVPLPPLHDYQQGIVNDLGQLLRSGSGRRRAIVSLPTGGGKTRVAGEAVVRLVLSNDGNRTALWVAQTDELCEQAVQCFQELWANIGVPFETLRIARLWGNQKTPPPPHGDGPVVVVASIQTLASRFHRKEMEWLKDPGIIVIDECHHAITYSYSELFRWLDLQIGNERARDREPPVLGLSATPWRGFSDDESERLAARFDRRWLPVAQEELHGLLSQMGVLAARRYSPIRYNREVMLTEAELRLFEKFNELPESVTSRIGEDEARNDLIVDAILGSEARSILLFANSVAHAQHLAARLHLAGCPAAAVSGETDRLSRQHFTKLFRNEGLRVICNHSVLTTGFDAPKADMVFISRPVFSPVLYMQMVGRGLRGPANGGTAHCEIMTVEDNILNFKDQLAFHFCRRFFDGASEEFEE